MPSRVPLKWCFFLGNNASKYVPHPNLGGAKPQTEKDKADEKVSKCHRKGEKKASLEHRKKKDNSFASKKLFSQARCLAKSQAARDRALDDIPLPYPTAKHKQSALGPNVSFGDASQNAEPADSGHTYKPFAEES
ncbi:hypothetical protein R1flu_006022 [Riccia fluitans]|uniref:Uncharacterized protein n=1 Tax=Riccia fluitans TaxID=41844 RepID=A0ABD1YV22_9MARC